MVIKTEAITPKQFMRLAKGKQLKAKTENKSFATLTANEKDEILELLWEEYKSLLANRVE